MVGRASDRGGSVGRVWDRDSSVGRVWDRDSSVGRVWDRDSSAGRVWDRDSSVGRALYRKARRNTNVGSIRRCGKAFFFLSFLSESTFSADPPTVFVQPPSAIARINTCATLKIPKTGSRKHYL